ncbi:MAG: EamA/RhaT family transporter, partial [Caldilineae bacterium]
MSYRTAILLQALAAILLSTAGLLIKVITLNPMALLGLRSLIAAVVIGLYMGKPRFTWSLPQVGGALAVVGAQAFFILATRETTAANAIFIQYTAPIYVALFGVWFLHEPVRRVDWWTMAAVGVGLFLFLNDGLTAGNMRGNAYALLAGISFAWFLLFMRKQKDASPIETVFLGNVLAAAVGVPFLVGQSPTLGDWAGVTFLGAFQIGLPFILMSYTIKRLTAVETVLIQTLEPICNPIWVVLV